MATLAFDTLAFSKKLRGQFTPEQADTLAEAFVAGANEQLATKSDLKELELRLDARFAQLEARLDERLAQVDVKIASLEVKIASLETKIAETANRMIVWTVGSIFSSAALIIAVEKFVR